MNGFWIKMDKKWTNFGQNFGQKMDKIAMYIYKI